MQYATALFIDIDCDKYWHRDQERRNETYPSFFWRIEGPAIIEWDRHPADGEPAIFWNPERK